MRRLSRILLLLPVLGVACGQVDQGKPAAPETGAKASALTGQKTVWVIMKKQANLNAARTIKDWKARGTFVVNKLQSEALTSQGGVKSLLDARGAKYEPHWIINTIKVTADQATIEALDRHPDVAKIVADRTYTIPTPIRGKALPKTQATEWGLNNIRAPQAWATFGARGQGIVVANIDTGVEFAHPALATKYRGRRGDGTVDHNYNWVDPANVCGGTPCDNAGHGTHTMGTMVGDDGDPGPNQIGVAPGARWIAAKGCESNSCSLSSLTAAGEWILAPRDLSGNNPRPDMRPHIVNNSWGGGSGDPFYQSIVQAWVAAGIFPIFSNGNGGPSCGSAGSPGDYPESYSVGAYDINNNIASFSSRGPSALGGGVKPDIAAPGVNVRSSVPGGGYESFSGTSMSAPHVAGTVALIWSAAPSLVGDIAATRALLGRAAVNVNNTTCGGTEENNNVFGEGRLDAYAAVDLAPRGPTGTLNGTVTSAGGPIAGARVVATADNTTRVAETDASGAYSMLLPVGTYTVTVSAFGYISQTANGVVIAQDTTTTRNFTLVAAPSHAVSGVVRDGAGNPLPGARVVLLNTPVPPAVTGADGRYSFAAVPTGTYQVLASGGRCFEGQTQELVVDGAETLDFTLPLRTDAFGYFCQDMAASYIEANTPVALTGDDASTPVTLPFPFYFYGQTYTTAHVATNGFINFLAPNSAFSNSGIPSPAQPNAAIYAFWDDLVVDGSASVRTETVGSAPNRKFVIEWRNVRLFSNPNKRLDVEIVLGENGQITTQYRNVDDDPEEQGSSATIGIEDQAGAVGLQYSTGEAAVGNNSAILFRLPPSGFIEGTVTDANDGLPVSGAIIRVLSGDRQIRTASSASDGTYRVQVPVGTYTIEATTDDYSRETATVTVAEDARVTRNFVLRTARAVAKPGALKIIVPTGKVRTRTLSLRNTGSLNLEWQIGESGGQPAATAANMEKPRNPTADQSARDTRGLFAGGVAVGWRPTAPGNVIRSFPPTGLALAWGVGFAGNVWLSDVPNNKRNHEFTPQGQATGRAWAASWASAWNADMAWDSQHNLMCQVNVGGDNGIYCWELATGNVGGSITGAFPWTATSQRGLAYRPDDDSFYIGGWNEGTVYHVKGLSHADKGAVIGSCRPADGAISGMAYNPASETLWVATNSQTDTIYQLDPDDCTVLSTLPHPTPGFKGGGLDMADDGNLWTVSQNPNMVYLIESGVPAFNDVPWLTVSSQSGTIAPGGRQNLTVTVDTTGLAPGTYLATLFIQSNSGRAGSMRIPVSLIVPAFQKGVNAGSNDTLIDTYGDPWIRDKQYRAGDWGYLQDNGTESTSRTISGTPDPDLYRKQRVDPYAYRFDNLPNGVYKVELRFAELERVDVGERLFDVIIKNKLVLPAHDIVYRVGRYAADKHGFFVTVDDGRLDIRFIARRGYDKPVINSLRVTHRPDRQ